MQAFLLITNSVFIGDLNTRLTRGHVYAPHDSAQTIGRGDSEVPTDVSLTTVLRFAEIVTESDRLTLPLINNNMILIWYKAKMVDNYQKERNAETQLCT